MSSYDEVMAESRRLAQRQIQQRNEANAAAWARAHPNTPPPRPKTRFLFFEWDAFDLFCCAPQACALHLEDPLEAAEYDDYDDYDDARAGGVLLDVEIDKRQGLGGSVHTIQLEARLEEDVPAMSPATSDLGRPRDNAKRLSGQDKRAKFQTSKPHISAVFHSFWLIFGRAIISWDGLEAWMLFPERARAKHSR